MKVKDLVIGQEITIDNKLCRRYIKSKAFWQLSPIITPKKVIVIGLRTIKDGKVDCDPDIGNIFETIASFTSILVVDNIRKKPFYTGKYENVNCNLK